MAPKEMIKKGRPSSRAPLSTPPDSPEPPLHSFTVKDAKELFDLVKAIAAMHTVPNSINPHCRCSQTPLNSPVLQTSSPPVTREDLKQLLLEVIQERSNPQELTEAAKLEDVKPEKEIVRASRLEFTTVNEVYVSNTIKIIKLTVSQLE
jgi:hypothetical protein